MVSTLRKVFPILIISSIASPAFASNVEWVHEGPITAGHDKVCLLHHSAGITFRIRMSLDRLEIGFFQLDQSAFDDAQSPFFRVNMRVDEIYTYSSKGEIIEGGPESPTVSVMASTVDDRFIDALEAGQYLYLDVSKEVDFGLEAKRHDRRYELQGSKAAIQKLYECRAKIIP